MLPDIMSWPRGSNIRPVRIQSNSFRKCCRRSLMLAPSKLRPAAGDDAHRIAAGVGVDAGKREASHVVNLLRARAGALRRMTAGPPD